MQRPGRWARETGATLLVGLLVLVLIAPAALAEEDLAGALTPLEELTAALESEADLLGWLAGQPQVGGPADLAGYLSAVEVRVMRLQVEAGETVAGLLVGMAGPATDAAGLPVPGFPLLGSPGAEQGPAPLADGLAAYRRALERVLGWQEALAARVAGDLAGLPPPGRVCPVDGLVGFSHTWGEERPWGREHKGEDLHAELGTPLVAVESGTIIESGWHWAGGFGFWLAGRYSGNVYYYAHLMGFAPDMRPGAEVEAGALVGWVGSTGNATSPHLHFGWIPDDPGHWADLTGLADPYPLLVGLCG